MIVPPKYNRLFMSDSVPTGFVPVCPECRKSDEVVLKGYNKYYCKRCDKDFPPSNGFPSLRASTWSIGPGTVSGVVGMSSSFSVGEGSTP